MVNFRSRGRGSKRTVYPLTVRTKRAKRTVSTKLTPNYRQEIYRQRQKQREETKRNIMLLKKEYIEDLKDIRKGEFPEEYTEKDLTHDYIRELNILLEQFKNPPRKLVPPKNYQYGP